MKQLNYIWIVIMVLLLGSCGEEFLEREQLFEQSSGTFYSNPQEINSGLAAAYSRLAISNATNNPILMANLLSDDCFGGGGPSDAEVHDTDRFINTVSSRYESLWQQYYAGILRTNLIIEKIDNVEYKSDEEKKQAKGEALFLRAYYHFKLTQFFGRITIKKNSAPGEDKQASFEEIYSLIASDLKEAINIMPDWGFEMFSGERNGRASKWAAEALMGRVFLFYTGYHNKNEISLESGSPITKQMVIEWLDDCIANSGYALVDDFRNLWPYASTGTDTGEYQYPWAINQQLNWVGDGNIETLFAVKYSMYSDFGAENNDLNNPYASKIGYSNQLTLYMAFRAQEQGTLVFPFGMGWGSCPVNPQLHASYDNLDLRKMGSICNVLDPNEGLISENYEWGKWDHVNETGFGQKKYNPILRNSDKGPRGMYSVKWGAPFSYMLECMQDEVIIRFADVILMAAELKEDVELINKIRFRAGLDPLASYSLMDLQNERRWELAFEGLRYHDMLRWGIAEQEFAKVVGVPVRNANEPSEYSSTYRSETKGLLPIPESQIAISNGALVQNEGW